MNTPEKEHADVLIESEKVYDGRIVNLSLDTVRFPNGETGTIEMIRHSGASAVVPFLDPPTDDDPRIVLIHQYRYAGGGYLYEVPAGRPDRIGEPWEECAARELEEETGYIPGALHRLTSILTTPGFTDETIHLFAATDLTRGEVARDHDEFLEIVEMSLSRALALVQSGEVSDAKTICSILFAARWRTSLS